MQRNILIGALAGGLVLGAGAVAGAAVGAGPFAPNHDASGTTPTSLPDDQPGTDLPIGSSQTFPTGDAGFVTVRRDTDGLHVVSTTTADGWTPRLGDDTGHEVRVTFTRADGTLVTFEAELEHGGVRIGVEPGDDHGGAREPGDDNSGPGSANSGPGSSGAPPPTAGDTPAPTVEDATASPPPTVDDHGGSSGPGGSSGSGSSGSGGADDGPSHDAGDDHGGSSGHG